MLFNSYEFLCVFLPAVFLVTCLLGSVAPIWRVWFLIAASLFFYSWWNPPLLLLLLASILGNYLLARIIETRQWRWLLAFAIVINLSAIAYYKYWGFFSSISDFDSAVHFKLADAVIPLGISFFTFQQIAYLVDAYHNRLESHRLPHYMLFVSFFPQLIAGPIVHQRELIPQLAQDGALRARALDTSIGLTVFAIGLFKKVVIADNLAPFASPVFDAALDGRAVDFFAAWQAALAYTFQLYFDFSGYSDMAFGLAKLFGVTLPINFLSPYKATSLVEFWRRWHITLSRFLRECIYVPLGGNRVRGSRFAVNLMTVMLIGGLWHGAGWTFIAWGAVHGIGLVTNHLVRRRFGASTELRRALTFGHFLRWGTTFLFVLAAWVLFRAESLAAATEMYRAMIGLNGMQLPHALQGSIVQTFLSAAGLGSVGGPDLMIAHVSAWLLLFAAAFVCFVLPNTYEWIKGDYRLPIAHLNLPSLLSWNTDAKTGAAVAAALLVAVYYISAAPSEFLYFQF